MPTEADLYWERHERAEELFQALLSGKADEARAILKDDPSLAHEHQPYHFDASAMNLAAMGGSTEAVDLLLDLGVSPDFGSIWWAGSFSPLMSAVLREDDAMIRHLIARGATVTAYEASAMGDLDALKRILDQDPASANMRAGDGQTPLHVAATVEAAKLLLERGSDLEARDVDHESTPAQYAMSRPAVAEFLLSRGAKGDAFLYAALQDPARLKSELLENPACTSLRIGPETFSTTPPAAEIIYSYIVGTGCTPLHVAANFGRTDSARLLADAGADPNARGGYDDAAPLHLAAWNDHGDVIRALAGCGAELDALSGELHHNSALGWAVVGGSPDAVQALLDKGAKVEPRHVEDARLGAAGEFIAYKRQSVENWKRVLAILEG